jgi:hypothetical protein
MNLQEIIQETKGPLPNQELLSENDDNDNDINIIV